MVFFFFFKEVYGCYYGMHTSYRRLYKKRNVICYNFFRQFFFILVLLSYPLCCFSFCVNAYIVLYIFCCSINHLKNAFQIALYTYTTYGETCESGFFTMLFRQPYFFSERNFNFSLSSLSLSLIEERWF